jgi:hypothetical protein
MLTTTVTAKPASQPVSLVTLRLHCRVSHRYDDELLTAYCDAAVNMVEAYTARALITQTLTMTSTPTPAPLGIAMTTGPIIFPLWFPLVGYQGRRIELPRSPVQSVTSITITHPDGTIETADPSQFVVDNATDPAAVLLNGFSLNPTDRMAVSYVAGYGNSPDTVPASLRQAVLLITAHLYTHRGDDDLSELPTAAKRLCDPHRVSFFGGVTADGR